MKRCTTEHAVRLVLVIFKGKYHQEPKSKTLTTQMLEHLKGENQKCLHSPHETAE